jgi:hypothetical protein
VSVRVQISLGEIADLIAAAFERGDWNRAADWASIALARNDPPDGEVRRRVGGGDFPTCDDDPRNGL